jgi:hypothetical protein
MKGVDGVIDLHVVVALRLDSKLLRIACPYCEQFHYHLMRSRAYDVRESNCRGADLPKRLRKQMPLHYRIEVPRMEDGRRGEVIRLKCKGGKP